MTNLTLYSLTALLILDSTGSRILAKYYSPPAAVAAAAAAAAASSSGSTATTTSHQPPNTPRQLTQASPFPTLKEQRAFEKSVLEKVAKKGSAAAAAAAAGNAATEIQLLDSHLLLSKSSLDVHLVVVAPAEENELMVSHTLSNLWEALSMLLAGQGVEKRTLLENLDLVTLAVDEAIDDGCVHAEENEMMRKHTFLRRILTSHYHLHSGQNHPRDRSCNDCFAGQQAKTRCHRNSDQRAK